MTGCCCCCLFPTSTCNCTGTCAGGVYTYARDATVLGGACLFGLRLLVSRCSTIASWLDWALLWGIVGGTVAMVYGQASGGCTCSDTSCTYLCGWGAAVAIGASAAPLWIYFLLAIWTYLKSPFRRVRLAWNFGVHALYTPYPFVTTVGRGAVSVEVEGFTFTMQYRNGKYYSHDSSSGIKLPVAIHGPRQSREVRKKCEEGGSVMFVATKICVDGQSKSCV